MLHIKIYDVPTKEIDRTIEWLEQIKKDCEFRIWQLQQQKKSTCRTARWRQMMNDLAEDVYYSNSELFSSGSYESRISYIKDHLDCDEDRAKHVYEVLQRWAKNKRRKNRDEEIVALAQSGERKAVIAKKYNLTPQQIYNILNQHEKQRTRLLK